MGRGSDRGYPNTAGLASPRRPLASKTGMSAGRDQSALLGPPLGHGDVGRRQVTRGSNVPVNPDH